MNFALLIVYPKLKPIIGDDCSSKIEEMRRCTLDKVLEPVHRGCKFVPKDYELIMYLKKRIEEDPHDPVFFSKDCNNIRDVKSKLFIDSPPKLLGKF